MVDTHRGGPHCSDHFRGSLRWKRALWVESKINGIPGVRSPAGGSRRPSTVTSVPLARGLPRCRRLFLAARACARRRAVRRRRVTASPHHRLFSRRNKGLPGSWTVLFLRAGVEHPAGYGPLPAHRNGEFVAFRTNRTLGIRDDIDFEAPPGPHARVPTLRRPRCRDRRQARYRLGRAHPWPGGLRTRWTTNEVS